MAELDLNNWGQTDYQVVVRKFDRIPSGGTLTVLSDRDPEWLVEMVEELRPLNFANYEFTEDDNHNYAVKLRKSQFTA